MAERAADDPELRRAVLELQAGARIEDNSRFVFERYYPWVRRFFRRLALYTISRAELDAAWPRQRERLIPPRRWRPWCPPVTGGPACLPLLADPG